jgi:superkiller protein 3
MDSLALYFHDSPFYNVLSQLPPPDPTNPTATTTFAAQSAIQDSLPLYEEIANIVERQESDLIEAEVKKRRQRIDAPRPEQVRRDVDQEVLTISRVRHRNYEIYMIHHSLVHSFPNFTTRSLVIQMQQTKFDAMLRPSFFDSAFAFYTPSP